MLETKRILINRYSRERERETQPPTENNRVKAERDARGDVGETEIERDRETVPPVLDVQRRSYWGRRDGSSRGKTPPLRSASKSDPYTHTQTHSKTHTHTHTQTHTPTKTGTRNAQRPDRRSDGGRLTHLVASDRRRRARRRHSTHLSPSSTSTSSSSSANLRHLLTAAVAAASRGTAPSSPFLFFSFFPCSPLSSRIEYCPPPLLLPSFTGFFLLPLPPIVVNGIAHYLIIFSPPFNSLEPSHFQGSSWYHLQVSFGGIT